MTSAARLDTMVQDRQLIEEQLHAILPQVQRSPATQVCEAMRYAVFGSGQRLRPILALRIARMLGTPSTLTLRAAAAVELMHCASLIVDDLPCMDDERFRRNRPAVHIAFGEANAVLAAFGLVALAARSVVDLNCRPWEFPCLLDFQVRLLGTLDCESLIGGQALDLALDSEERDTQRHRLASLKTAPLFELAVRAGSLFARLSATEEQCLVDFGREFGLAYQLRDDHNDGEMGSEFRPQDPFARARECLAPFGQRAEPLACLIDYLDAQKHSCHR